MKNLIIFGNKSTALEIHDTASRCGYDMIFNMYFDLENPQDSIEAVRAIFQMESPSYIVGIADITIRKKIIGYLQQIPELLPCEPIIHPSSKISTLKNVHSEGGTYIGANCTLSTNCNIGEHVIINHGTTIGHDASIASLSTLNVGVCISGNCKIGTGVLIGSNYFVFQGTRIGDDSVIDAMCYIRHDIPNNTMVLSALSKQQIHFDEQWKINSGPSTRS